MPLNAALKIGLTVALSAANMALTMTRKIEGQRLDELKFTGGDYGAALPMVWGLRRMEVPIFWAEDLREVKRRRKTKGGKFNEYTYYGTWAVALAGHQIEAVRRIWFDTHLVFDLSGAGPVTPFDFGTQGGGKGSSSSTAWAASDNIAIYLGTADQEPDPRMQATVEAEFGEGACPAYRDTAYIVFKDVPLEKIGNRIPQVSVEYLGASGDVYPIDFAPGEVFGHSDHRVFSPDYALMLKQSFSEFSVYDVAGRAQISSGSLAWNHGRLRRDGTILGATGAGIAAFDLFGNYIGLTHAGYPDNYIELVYDGDGGEHIFQGASFVNGVNHFDGGMVDLDDLFDTTGYFGGVFVDLDGNVWGVGKVYASATEVHFYRFVTITSDLPGQFTVTGMPSYTGGGFGPGCHYRDADVDHFVIQWGEDLYAIDPVTLTVDFSQTGILSAHDDAIDSALRNLPSGSSTIWVGAQEFALADLSQIRQIAPSNWDGDFSSTGRGHYDPINHALIFGNSAEQAEAWCYLDRVGPGDLTLGEICEDVAAWCGVTDYDFSDLDQPITGWSATRGDASNILEPLLDAFDSDFRPHDFGIEGIKRTGVAAGAVLETALFTGDPRYTVTVRQAPELPRAIIVDFADVDADQQPGSVRSDRPIAATDARGESKLDLTTLVLDADEARALGDRYFRRTWNERKTFRLGLTAQLLALEPGDVRTLSLDGAQVTARCIRTTMSADDHVDTEWLHDNPSLALSDGAAGASFDGRKPQAIAVPLISKGFVMDLPLLSDADDAATPLLYTAAAPFVSGTWSGAAIYEAVDGEFSEELAEVPSSSPAAWGYATDALADADPWVWDRGNSVNVELQVGSLSGASEDAIDANPLVNLCLLGDELMNFTTATLEGDGTYTLTGLKRARRGTEQHTGTHAARDVFLLLDTAEAQAMGLSDVGTDLTFKAITVGRTEAGAAEIPVSFTGASLKPWSPVHLEAVKESSGDWTLTWTRRTRVGGAWTSGTTIPLGEASEAYEVTVGDGVSSATKSAASETYTWTLADQTTDTGGEVLAGSLEWSVAQVSDAVGAGFPAEATA